MVLYHPPGHSNCLGDDIISAYTHSVMSISYRMLNLLRQPSAFSLTSENTNDRL